MKTRTFILSIALVMSAISCGKVDPGTIDDPVADSDIVRVVITVGRGAETKTSVSDAGIVSFTEDDTLNLFQTVEDASGNMTTTLLQSSGISLSSDGSRASFTFDIGVSDISSEDKIVFHAATGDWNIEDEKSAPVVNIPNALNANEYAESVLPPNGVITMSDPILASKSDISESLNGSVQLNHVVDYGILNVQNIPTTGKVTNISLVETSGNGIAGPAVFGLSDGCFTDVSSNSLEILPNTNQQSLIQNNTGTAIWFTIAPLQVPFTNRSGKIIAKTDQDETFETDYDLKRSPDEPEPPIGSSTEIKANEWTSKSE